MKRLLFVAVLFLTPLPAMAQTVTPHSGCNPGIACQAASFSPTSSTIPTAGIYSNGSGGISTSTAGVARITTSSSGATTNTGSFLGSAAASYLLSASGASSTVPTVIPNRADTTTGMGAQASGNVSVITGGAERQRWTAGGILYLGTIPVVTGTGTPAITTGSTDSAGEVTGGTLATSIVITFAAAKTNTPFCVVTAQTQVAAFAYAISTTAITITLTATTGEKIDYICTQH